MSLACFVRIHKKMPIMAHRGTRLACQTCLAGHTMPHIYMYVTGSHQPFSLETWWSEDLSLKTEETGCMIGQ